MYLLIKRESQVSLLKLKKRIEKHPRLSFSKSAVVICISVRQLKKDNTEFLIVSLKRPILHSYVNLPLHCLTYLLNSY